MRWRPGQTTATAVEATVSTVDDELCVRLTCAAASHEQSKNGTSQSMVGVGHVSTLLK